MGISIDLDFLTNRAVVWSDPMPKLDGDKVLTSTDGVPVWQTLVEFDWTSTSTIVVPVLTWSHDRPAVSMGDVVRLEGAHVEGEGHDIEVQADEIGRVRTALEDEFFRDSDY